MKVVFDDVVYSLQKAGGVSVMWNEITKHSPFPSTHLRYDNSYKNVFAEVLEGHEYEIYKSIGITAKRFTNVRRHETEPYLFHSSFYRYCHDKKAINITNLYDFTFELFFHGLIYQPHIIQKKNTAMHSDGIICISNNTKQDLLRYYPDYKGEIAVIYCGYDENTYYYVPAEKEPIVLFVGSRAFYKRFEIAAEIVKAMPTYKLVVVGGGDFTKKELDLLNAMIPQRYEKAGYLSNDELRSLYNKASYLIYCSDYEGFGIPPLEAQACGCPVICQRKSSVPEVVGDAAVFLDPDNIREAIDVIKELDRSSSYVELVQKGLENSKRFSWTKCCNEVYEFYQYMFDIKGIR